MLLADDQQMVREGLKQLLRADSTIEVVTEAADGQEAVDLIRSTRPDVCLLDIRMPKMDGIAVVETIQQDPNPPAMVMVTTFDLDDYLYRSLRAGAVGFVLKDASARVIIESVMAAASGEALVSPALTGRLIDRFVDDPPTDAGHVALTDREREALRAVATGMTNNEIATHLHISLSTTKGYLESLMRKTESRNRVELVIWAYQVGLKPQIR